MGIKYFQLFLLFPMVLLCYLAHMSKNKEKTLSIRIPQLVAKALQKRAKGENRSINKQIIHEITAYGLEYAIREPIGK